MAVLVDVARLSSLSVSTAYHSCIGDTLSDKKSQESVYSSYSADHPDPQVEPEPITREHYEQLRISLGNPSRLEPPNFRSDAREKLAHLTRVQFLEFAMDVHDEVNRIEAIKSGRTLNIATPRNSCSPHRIEARRKISHLHPDVLENLMSDIFYELGRRYPKFKETKASFDLEYTLRSSGVFETGRGARAPLAPIDVNQNLRDLVMGSIMTGVTNELNDRCIDTISSAMSITEIILILGQHGCPNITGILDINKCDRAPIAGGGFGDVYHGYLCGDIEVAIKCPRFFASKSEITRDDLKAAARELHAWSKYNHPNVVQLLGVAQFRDRIAMISPWMKKGTLCQYLIHTPNMDRFRLCHEIASGVAYLHSMGTVHGDIKGLNVLISQGGNAKLIDFGNSRLKNSTLNFTGTQTVSSFSTRWTAPELLADGGAYTMEADVYALGMTILEVITGNVPFPEIKNESAVISRVVFQKQHPERPMNVIPASDWQNNTLWTLLVWCWNQDPLARPQASEIVSRIAKITRDRRSMTHPDEFGRLFTQMSPALSKRFK